MRSRKLAAGSSLLELVFTLAVTSAAAGIAGSTISGLAGASYIQTARLRTLTTLLEARRRAYGNEATVQVDVASGAGSLTVHDPDGTSEEVALPPGVVVTGAPTTGRVRFFASSLADNATIVLGDTAGTGTASIVVNQRGLLR